MMCDTPYHPEDPEGRWDYDSCPDPDEYWKEDGNFERYSDDYDDWYSKQDPYY